MRNSLIMSAISLDALKRRAKTQSRRLLDPQPRPGHYLQPMWGRARDSGGHRGKGARFGERWLWREVGPDYPDGPEDDRRCPYGRPGAVLWVRETWCTERRYDATRPADLPAGAKLHYLADGARPRWAGRVRSPLFLPRQWARWQLTLLDVRLAQLQTLSDADARAEGATPCPYVDGHPRSDSGGCLCHLMDKPMPHVCTFIGRWDELHGPTGSASWFSNPWIWALTFAPRDWSGTQNPAAGPRSCRRGRVDEAPAS